MSNAQLGGPQVMHFNGITHETVSDDFRAIKKYLKWLSYVPKTAHSPLPLPSGDALILSISPPSFVPESANFDSRELVAGLFDRDSVDEILAGWAKGIIVGRARLNGLPLGFITAQNHATDLIIPSDPADIDSEEHKMQVPAKVLFPDSSFKIAQV